MSAAASGRCVVGEGYITNLGLSNGTANVRLSNHGSVRFEATRSSAGAATPILQTTQVSHYMSAGRSNLSAHFFTQALLPQWCVHEAGVDFYAAGCSSHSKIGASKNEADWVGLAPA